MCGSTRNARPVTSHNPTTRCICRELADGNAISMSCTASSVASSGMTSQAPAIRIPCTSLPSFAGSSSTKPLAGKHAANHATDRAPASHPPARHRRSGHSLPLGHTGADPWSSDIQNADRRAAEPAEWHLIRIPSAALPRRRVKMKIAAATTATPVSVAFRIRTRSGIEAKRHTPR